VGLVLHTSRFAIMDLAQITGFVTGKILLNPSQTGPIITTVLQWKFAIKDLSPLNHFLSIPTEERHNDLFL
jgi:hypothetical protein